MSGIIEKRYDFIYLFDVKDGNPNGDPDFGNTPRFDPETFQGLVSDVCLKRKIRNFVLADPPKTDENSSVRYNIYVQQGHSLESRQMLPYQTEELKGKAKGKDTDKADEEMARRWMCREFFDVRAFGAVMSTTEFRCGQVRGPVQMTFARSFHRILTTDHAITRVAYTQEKKQEATAASTEIGHKQTVAYGLYSACGHVNPHFAEIAPGRGTGFTIGDLDMLWKAMKNMLGAFDASAARGLMAARHLFIFEHASKLGEAPAHKLFDLVTTRVRLKEGIESPRNYTDYVVPALEEIRKGLPSGVTVRDLVNE